MKDSRSIVVLVVVASLMMVGAYVSYASEARPSLVAELQHMAGLPSSEFPSEGTLSLRFETVQLRWNVRIVSEGGECILTPILG
jgi:hypothetical protein